MRFFNRRGDDRILDLIEDKPRPQLAEVSAAEKLRACDEVRDHFMVHGTVIEGSHDRLMHLLRMIISDERVRQAAARLLSEKDVLVYRAMGNHTKWVDRRYERLREGLKAQATEENLVTV